MIELLLTYLSLIYEKFFILRQVKKQIFARNLKEPYFLQAKPVIHSNSQKAIVKFGLVLANLSSHSKKLFIPMSQEIIEAI